MENNLELKKYIRYVSLNVLGMLGVSCYILVDTFFIAAGMGTTGLAALNLAIPAFNFIYSFGLMLGMGGATRYTIAQSRGLVEEAGKIFNNTVIAGVIISTIFEIVGFLFCEEITYLLGADEETFEMTYTYMRMLFLFSPAFTFNNIMMAFVRNDGSPNLSMSAQLTGSFSNILLDYVFIFPLGMGIFGAVLATCLSPIISLSVLSIHKIKGKNRFHIKKTVFEPSRLGGIMSLGMPSFITEMSTGLVIMIFNMIILGLEGNVGVAAYGVVANISIVVTAIFTGIAQGTQPLISHSHGRDDSMAIKKYVTYAVITIVTVSVAVYIVIFVFAKPITAIFNSENDALLEVIAIEGLKIYFAAVFFVGFNIFISLYFSSVEKALPAQIISMARGIVVIIPMAFLLSYIFKMQGVWLSYPVTEAFVSLMGLVFIKASKKHEAD